MSEKDRFCGTFAEEEKTRRDIKLLQKEQKLAQMKRQQIELQKQREENKKVEQARYMQRMKYLQQKGSPKNESSVPYDPLTLQYNDSYAGRKLKYEDDKVKYRAKLRSRKLYYEQNRNGFNPVTGEAAQSAPLPSKPVKPVE